MLIYFPEHVFFLFFALRISKNPLHSQSLGIDHNFYWAQFQYNFYPWPDVKWRHTELLLATTAGATAKSLQSCPTLCDPIDGSPLGFSVPGILQTRILEWVAISFSNAWKWKVKVNSLSHARLLATPWTAAYQAPPSMEFSRQELPFPSPMWHWVFQTAFQRCYFFLFVSTFQLRGNDLLHILGRGFCWYYERRIEEMGREAEKL